MRLSAAGCKPTCTLAAAQTCTIHPHAAHHKEQVVLDGLHGQVGAQRGHAQQHLQHDGCGLQGGRLGDWWTHMM